MKWLIETSVWQNDDNPKKMENAVTKLGHEAILYQYVPYKFNKEQILPINHKTDEPILVYGSIQFIKICQKLTNWIPCAWCNWEDLRCSSYISKLNHSIHQEYAYISLGEFLKDKDRLFKTFGSPNSLYNKDLDLFVKSDTNDKCIAGEKISLSMFEDWKSYIFCYEPALNHLLLISKPYKISSEWRCVVAGDVFITGSQYRRGGEVEISPDCTGEVIEFVKERAKELKDISPIFCIDVGQLDTGELKVIEIGSFNCAGLYDCNIEAIVNEASILAIKEFESYKL